MKLKRKAKIERKSNILISILANQTRKNKLFCYQSKLKTASAKVDVTIDMNEVPSIRETAIMLLCMK